MNAEGKSDDGVTPLSRVRLTNARAVGILIAAFVIAAIAVDPRGDFPLDDDWGVGFTTFTLVNSGTIELTPFASATAYLQFFWGALWAALFGQTFTVLRLATLTLSLGSTLLVYALLRRLRVAPALAMFGAAALLFHPLFFWASYTSMTHVPFVFMSLLALHAFVLAWEREGVWLLVAFAACAASFFTRQFAVLNALAPFVVALSMKRKRIAWTYAAALAVFGLLVVSGVLVGSKRELSAHRPTTSKIAFRAAHYAFFNWQNAALFFAPALALALLSKPRPRLSRAAAGGALLLFGYASARLAFRVGMPIPYMNSGNVFTDFGLGPPTLRDVFTLHMPHPFALPWSLKMTLMVVTSLAAVVAFALVVRLIRDPRYLVRFCVAYLLAATMVASVMSINFDRYSVDTAWPFLILLVVLVSSLEITPPGRWVAAGLMAVAIVFAIAGTAEYLAWNRARWAAYGWMRSGGVTLEQMDGGYEINAMLALRHGRKDLGKRGVGVIDDRYIIGFNRVPGYVTLRSFEYPRWLGLSRGWLHVQRRL